MSGGAEARPKRQEQYPAREEVDEVANGVLRIQLPISFPGLGHVNCYVMEDKDGITLIDPGLPGYQTWRRLKSKLGSVGVSVRHVKAVVVTHSHPDHFGQVPRLRKAAGAEIITHRSFRTFLDPEAEQDDDVLTTRSEPDDGPNTAEELAPGSAESATPGCGHSGHHPGPGRAPLRSVQSPFSGSTPWGGKPFDLPFRRKIHYRAMRWANGRFMSAPRPTKRVDDADVLELGGRSWVAVHTPGHTDDHLCLWDPDGGVMISGDHVLPTITPHISGLSEDPDPLGQFFASLDRMASYGSVRSVLPAHGFVFDDLAGRAEAIIMHHHERLDALREAGEVVGLGTVEDYMQQLFKPRSWGPMAESETYAHLEHLRLRRDADVHDDEPQLRYQIVR